MRTRSTFQGDHQMLPYHQAPEWIHLSELYHVEKNNLLEICLEKKFHSDEKVSQKWASLRPKIVKKRMGERRFFSMMRLHTPLCAFMEDIPDPLSHQVRKTYMDKGYHWIQRIRFQNKASHVMGVCDGIVQTAFLKTLLPTVPVESTAEYLLVFLKKNSLVEKSAMIRYFRNGEKRICAQWVVEVDVDGKMHVQSLQDLTLSLVEDHIRCLRKVKTWGAWMDLDDEDLPHYLLPNMKLSSCAWTAEREEIAHRFGEITMLWGCDDRHRQMAWEKGVFSWRDPRFSSELLGWTGTKAQILDRIVRVNQSTVPEDWLLVDNPEVLKDTFPLESTRHNLFVDFEYFVDDDFIYLIGVWDGDTQQYTAFWAEERTPESAPKMWKAFFDHVKVKDSRCWYWYAEKKMMDKTGIAYADDQWTDLWEVCRAGVAVRGAFDFGLKSFVRAFHQEDKMPLSYHELECQDGLASVTLARSYYETIDDDLRENLRKDLDTYNRYDCEAMAYILGAIRERLRLG